MLCSLCFAGRISGEPHDDALFGYVVKSNAAFKCFGAPKKSNGLLNKALSPHITTWEASVFCVLERKSYEGKLSKLGQASRRSIQTPVGQKYHPLTFNLLYHHAYSKRKNERPFGPEFHPGIDHGGLPRKMIYI